MKLGLKLFTLNLKRLPIIFLHIGFTALGALFSISLFLFVFHYYHNVWHMEFIDILNRYLFYFLPINIIIFCLMKVLFLDRFSILRTIFFTEHIVAGVLPSKIRQLHKAEKIFKRIFGNIKTLKECYQILKEHLARTNPIIYLLDLKQIMISYCTARNDEDTKLSSYYLHLYVQTYPTFFIKTKLHSFLNSIVTISILTVPITYILVEQVPNILNLPHRYALHLITGILIGYSLYKIFFAPYIRQLEIIRSLNFLKDKTLPSTLKPKKVAV